MFILSLFIPFLFGLSFVHLIGEKVSLRNLCLAWFVGSGLLTMILFVLSIFNVRWEKNVLVFFFLFLSALLLLMKKFRFNVKTAKLKKINISGWNLLFIT